MLLQDIQQTVNMSLKKGDAMTVETLRFLISAARNVAIAKYGAEAESKITDADVLDVIKKQVKTHKESVEAFEKADRRELAQKENAQLAILESYLPKAMSDEDLKALLTPIVEEGRSLPAGRQDFGPMMGKAMAVLASLPAGRQADGGRVSAMLKSLI